MSYAPLVIEVYENDGQPSSAGIRARVYPGQRYEAGRPVRWPRQVRAGYAPGTLFLVDAGETVPGAQSAYIRCRERFEPQLLTREEAADLIRRQRS